MEAIRNHIVEQVQAARQRRGLTWAEIADAIERPKEWTVAALLGQHPLPAAEAAKVQELLGLDDDVVLAMQRQPYRAGLGELAEDPTIYRFLEAIAVYGPAIKELIHEEFGDGIMSAINFKVDVSRRTDPSGDRVVVTFDGKFLDYQW
ncbi:MAG: cyanase [Propionibacteriaceae bacterium]|nr:cyanase [Propionibacteriaceae bacterium]